MGEGVAIYSHDRQYDIPSEEDHLQKKGKSFDVGLGALLIAKGIDPAINVEEYLREIDQLSHAISVRLEGTRDITEIAKAINHAIYADNGLSYKADKHFISDVFSEKLGNCTAFTCLYLAVAERLGLPFGAFRIPGHVFVRYRKGDFTINIETTENGKMRDDLFYGRMVAHARPIPESRPQVCEDLTTRQLLCMVLISRGLVHKGRGQFDKALRDFSLAIELDNDYPVGYNNRGGIYSEMGEYDKAIADFTRAIELDPYYGAAYNNRGLAHARKKDNRSAQEDWRRGAELTRRFTSASICPFGR
ncbi:MAG: tetratricopeptide repeat protein [Planctomycetota bacterium]|jgi:regulator of sirC expression with transglutaminase-like and TPR domain